MQVLEHNNITSFDIDGTLVIWPTDYQKPKKGRIRFLYGNEFVYLYEHLPHITFLKYCSSRGDFVEVWSKNKFAWAEQVVRTLQLEKYVDLVRSKPDRHVDDKVCTTDVVGERIFMDYNPEGKK